MVKESDSKSDGLCPHRFESCRLRNFFVFLYLYKNHDNAIAMISSSRADTDSVLAEGI